METAVPYQSTQELPDTVKDNLPNHAQEIYQKAFNNAWHEYRNPEDRRNNASQEETAHKVAWSAVKNKYEKQDDDWIKKED
jgi:cation transport regulator